jgi:hypothetical protein
VREVRVRQGGRDKGDAAKSESGGMPTDFFFSLELARPGACASFPAGFRREVFVINFSYLNQAATRWNSTGD